MGAAIEEELLDEEQEEVDKIELEMLAEGEKKWDSVRNETEEKIRKAGVDASKQIDSALEGLGKLQEEHRKATSKLEEELSAKKKKRQDALQKRLAEKRAKAAAKSFVSDIERQEIEVEIAEDEIRELSEIEAGESNALQELKAAQSNESKELVASLEKERADVAESDAESAAEAAEKATKALQ